MKVDLDTLKDPTVPYLVGGVALGLVAGHYSKSLLVPAIGLGVSAAHVAARKSKWFADRVFADELPVEQSVAIAITCTSMSWLGSSLIRRFL